MEIDTHKQFDWLKFWRIALPVMYLVIFLLPGYVFFHSRGGLGFLQGLSLKEGSLLLFPLVGLYAFFFIWAQLMIGSSMALLRKVYSWTDIFHHTEGVFALLFALLHPFLLLIGIGLTSYLRKDFVDPSLVIFVWIGQIQLVLMLLTVATALLRNVSWLRTRWRLIHRLNYVIFVLVWIHSWFLGSDVQSSNLKYVWFFFAVTAALATARRYKYLLPKRAKPAQSQI